MAVKYICDVCGRELKRSGELQKLTIPTYEAKGYPPIGEWGAYTCRECRVMVSYEASAAAHREVARIRRENGVADGKCKNVSTNPMRFECSRCGGVSTEMCPRFCPCCGAKVDFK